MNFQRRWQNQRIAFCPTYCNPTHRPITSSVCRAPSLLLSFAILLLHCYISLGTFKVLFSSIIWYIVQNPPSSPLIIAHLGDRQKFRALLFLNLKFIADDMGSLLPPLGSLQVKRVAIIGAGPSGLAVAKYLLAENAFDKIDIYEQQYGVSSSCNLYFHVISF